MASTTEFTGAKKEGCCILSFDGGGSKGVMELVLLKRVFDYVSLLQQRPDVVNWVHVKGNVHEETISRELGRETVNKPKVLPVQECVKRTSGSRWYWKTPETEANNQFVAVMNTFQDKLEVLEKYYTNLQVTDFTNYWMDYWHLIQKKDRQQCDVFGSKKPNN